MVTGECPVKLLLKHDSMLSQIQTNKDLLQRVERERERDSFFKCFSFSYSYQALVMMGCGMSKQTKTKIKTKTKTKTKRKTSINGVRVLKEKIRLLQGEIGEIRLKREKEIQVHEQVMMVFEIREEGWKKEKKKLREEVKRLKKKLEEKEEEMIMMVGKKTTSPTGGYQKLVSRQGDKFLMEYTREEQLRREEAVEKWKQLYLAIKMELDDLIQRTYRGKRVSWRVDDGMMEDIEREMKAKEETIQVLKKRVVTMEEEASKRGTEFDILRQSLRIISHTKKTAHVPKPRLALEA